jgi:apolipoprotein N-acyltransferase
MMNWRESAWFGMVATLLTGVLFYFSIDMGSVGPVALIAPIPLLIYTLAAPRAWICGLAAAVARAISLGGIIYAYGEHAPVAAMLTMIGIGAALYAVIILLTRWCARAAPPAIAVFSYPLLLATSEWLFGLVAPHGSFGAMGYALVDVAPLLQLASLGGMSALTVCVALVPMTIAVAIARPNEARSALVAGGIPVVVALIFGFARLAQSYESHARVALVGLDSFEARAFRGEEQDLETARAFAAQVRSLAAEHPDYIVLPEKQLGGARLATGSSRELALAAADVAPATVVVGFDEILPDGPRVNSAQILVPGKPLRRYLKRRVIPGVEFGYTLGTESYVDGTRGVAICKDMDFPGMIRDYGRRGVELLLVPAWDFVRDGRMHSRMALVRGVENGFAIARAATAGRLTASDRYGRVIAEATTSRDAPVTVVTDLGLRGGGTLYTRIGDSFAWLCAVLAAGLLAWRARRAIQHQRTTSPPA